MNHPLRWLSLVALERAELPPFTDVARWLKEHFPTAKAPKASGSTENLITLTIGDMTAAITLVPRPIPASQLEGPAATAWYWPGAAEALGGQAAHLLVTLVDEGGLAVTKAAVLTELTAAVAAVSRALGVFWGPSRTVHQPGAFIDQATQISEDNLPLFLWLDFRVESTGNGAYRLYTTGLEAMGQSELEVARFEGPPQELLDFAYNIAHYLLDKRKVVNDGDTIGLTDEVRATARRGKSMLGGDLDVITLEFERETA
jgi:hypothetical protein